MFHTTVEWTLGLALNQWYLQNFWHALSYTNIDWKFLSSSGRSHRASSCGNWWISREVLATSDRPWRWALPYLNLHPFPFWVIGLKHTAEEFHHALVLDCVYLAFLPLLLSRFIPQHGVCQYFSLNGRTAVSYIKQLLYSKPCCQNNTFIFSPLFCTNIIEHVLNICNLISRHAKYRVLEVSGYWIHNSNIRSVQCRNRLKILSSCGQSATVEQLGGEIGAWIWRAVSIFPVGITDVYMSPSYAVTLSLVMSMYELAGDFISFKGQAL